MAIFENTEKMYEVLGGLFELVLNDPEAGPKFKESGLVIKFNITDPKGTLWIDTVNMKVIGGAVDLIPKIEMTLSGDSCHDFWLKKLKLPVALAKGKIKAKGPMPAILKLLPLLKPAYEAYPEIAKNNNLPVD